MLVIIPTRIIPGVLLAAGFAGVGLGTAVAACLLFSEPSKLRFPHFVCLPLFALGLHYLRQVWREDPHRDAFSRAAALSPRLMAIMFGLCLLVGVATGVMIGSTFDFRK